VLAPSVVATVVDAMVRALLTSSAARRPEVARTAPGALVAAPDVTLVDDPTTPGAYGGFHFDDEGEPAVAQVLVAHGQLVGRLSDRAGVLANVAAIAGRGRRPGHAGWVEAMPSHLRLAPGTAAIALADGYQLEGGRSATVDPATGHTVIAVARALELKAGQPTGRVYADVELVGELTTLLGNVSEASKETRTYGVRDEVDALPRWRSFDVPYLRTTGMLRARRARS
jgi:predicted Zn-dependent protease